MAKDFTNYIKQFRADSVLYEFAKKSSQIFKRHLENYKTLKIGPLLEMPVIVDRGSYRIVKGNIDLTAWDISDIDYLTIKNSNDFRSKTFLHEDIKKATNLYRIYENNNVDLSVFDTELTGILKVFLGQTCEQLRFGDLGWMMNDFCRHYHILVASDKINRRDLEDIRNVVYKTMGIPVDDLLTYEFYILWLCCQEPLPIKAHEKYALNHDIRCSRVVIEKIVTQYSIDYQAVRDNPIGRQIFYSKPFIHTQKNEYIMSNMYLVAMAFADSLYWIIRDYYKNTLKSDYFVNTFGYLFEDYFSELADYFLESLKWGKIPEKKDEKSADFYLEFEDTILLFELKSGILPIMGRNQNPDVKQINRFLKDNIEDAYRQLRASEKRCGKDKKVVKIVLLYEFFNNIQFLQNTMPEIFANDDKCYIMTISELEALFGAKISEPEKFASIIKILSEGRNNYNEFPSVFHLISYNNLESHAYFTGERDYITFTQNKLAILLKAKEQRDINMRN